MPKQILRLGISPREVSARSAAKKKVKPRIRPDRGQKNAILPCSVTYFAALVAGTYPPYCLSHRCRWTDIARQPKLPSGVETYLLSACAATSYLLTLGMSFCSCCRRSSSSQTRRVVSGSALFWIMASSLATLGVCTGDTSLCLPLGSETAVLPEARRASLHDCCFGVRLSRVRVCPRSCHVSWCA